MPGMQFEYDEQGGTFYYFLLSFIALVLIPATYWLWPRKSSKDDQRLKRICHCEPCKLKHQIVKANQPWHGVRRKLIKSVIICGWIIFAFVAYKTTQVKLDFTEFDPFAELGIDRGADTAEIKKAYRQLSLVYHPDRETGDPVKFMRISKAYNALTNEEARKNWEEFGNPDGPGATHFGIALPKWIVEKQNSIWVLGVYALIFMILLPACVGTWWYRSIKYSAQQVLMSTSRSYVQFIYKSPNMILKRVIMVLSASCEFNKRWNNEIVERPSDNEEIPELLRDMPAVSQNAREIPFCIPYCVKARALLYAQFERKKLPPKTLEIDKQYILKKCPYLLNEMVSTALQLFTSSQYGRLQWKLNIDLLDNVMKVSQMTVQALYANKNPMLQLPHITEDMLRHFTNKKRNIRSLKQFVSMPDEDRRSVLRQLSDAEYADVLSVCAMMPNVSINVHYEVRGEEDKTVTAGSFITATVELRREPLIDIPMGVGDFGAGDDVDINDAPDEHLDEQDDDAEQSTQNHVMEQSAATNSKKWMKKEKKPAKKGKKKGGGGPPVKGGGPPPKKNNTMNHVSTNAVAVTTSNAPSTPDAKDASEKPSTSTDNATSSRRKQQVDDDDSAAGETSSGNDSEDDATSGGGTSDNRQDEDDVWDELQREARKDNMLETKSKEIHPVHCPYFPAEKFEWWWLYMFEAKKKQLVAGPLQICTLGDVDEKELRFSAPPKPGIYQYTIILRSDSYIGLDQSHTFKMDVKEARKMVESHPQWDFPDDEDDDDKKDDDYSSDSNCTTDDEASD